MMLVDLETVERPTLVQAMEAPAIPVEDSSERIDPIVGERLEARVSEEGCDCGSVIQAEHDVA